MPNGMIVGVGFLLFTQEDNPRLFVVRELEDKPEYCKQAGMVSFPVETFEEDDGSVRETIRRLIREEVGIDPEEVEIAGIEPGAFRLIPGRADVETRYGFGFFRGDPEKAFAPPGRDIEFVGWMTVEELLSGFVRIETRPVLEHFRVKYLSVLARRRMVRIV